MAPMTIKQINSMNNREFSQKIKTFNEACAKAGIPATKRQASKWRRGIGLARKFR